MPKAKRKASQKELLAQEVQTKMAVYADRHNATLIEWPDRVEQAARLMIESGELPDDDRADARELVGLVSCYRIQCDRNDIVAAGYDALRIGLAVQRINSRYSDTDKYFVWNLTPVKLSPKQRALAVELCGKSCVSVRRLKRAYAAPGSTQPSDGTLDTALSRLRTTLGENTPPIRVMFNRRGHDVLVMGRDA